MIKKILVVILVVIVSSISYAQEGTSSPYSFYGIGLKKFRGTVENRSMGGLGVLTDSIHLNLQNPASYGELGLTTYTIGANYNGLNLDNAAGDDSYKDNASLEYLAIGIPAGKFGFGFGILPLTAVGYQTNSFSEDGTESQFFGTGGVNRVYVSAGFKVNKNLSVGLDFNYNFGTIDNTTVLLRPDLQFGTREINSSNLTGVNLSFGLTYKTMITEKLELTSSVVSRPSFDLESESILELATIGITTTGLQSVAEEQTIEENEIDLEIPAEFQIGVGIGAPRKWYIGAEYTFIEAESFDNRSFILGDIVYENASQVRLGGFYIPKYNSLTSYLSKIVYRGGLRYEETGLHINGEAINEFGISFGVGLPVGNLFSNVNMGFEFGTRGTTNAGLVKEEFFNLSVSLSLNDKWFRKIKFN